MQWIRFIEDDQSDRLVVDELLADVLFCSAIYLCVSDIAAHIATCRALCKTSCLWGSTIQQQPYSLVDFCVCDVRTIQQQCGANHILSVKFTTYVPFYNSVGQTIFFLVNFHAHDVHTFYSSVGQTVFFQYTFANGMCVCVQQQCGINQ